MSSVPICFAIASASAAVLATAPLGTSMPYCCPGERARRQQNSHHFFVPCCYARTTLKGGRHLGRLTLRRRSAERYSWILRARRCCAKPGSLTEGENWSSRRSAAGGGHDAKGIPGTRSKDAPWGQQRPRPVLGCE